MSWWGATIPQRSIAFYDATFAALGISGNRMDERAYYGTYESGFFSVGRPRNGEAATHANGGTIGLGADDQAAVDAWHAAGLANGGSDDGAPGRRDMPDTKLLRRLSARSRRQQAVCLHHQCGRGLAAHVQPRHARQRRHRPVQGVLRSTVRRLGRPGGDVVRRFPAHLPLPGHRVHGRTPGRRRAGEPTETARPSASSSTAPNRSMPGTPQESRRAARPSRTRPAGASGPVAISTLHTCAIPTATSCARCIGKPRATA